MTRERINDMREVVLPFVKKRLLETNYEGLGEDDAKEFEKEFNEILNLAIKALDQEPRWIPVSERLPEDSDPVNITWVNRNPGGCYANIRDIPFTATGHYCNGKWWWFSMYCQDYLNEYGLCDTDAMDDNIEVIAWMPLPKPYKAESEKMKYKVRLIKEYIKVADSKEEAIESARLDFDYSNDSSFCQMWDKIQCTELKAESEE